MSALQNLCCVRISEKPSKSCLELTCSSHQTLILLNGAKLARLSPGGATPHTPKGRYTLVVYTFGYSALRALRNRLSLRRIDQMC